MRVSLTARLVAGLRGWFAPDEVEGCSRWIAVSAAEDACAGSFGCAYEAPSVFPAGTEGCLTRRPVAAAEDTEQVIRAIRTCPVDAIRLSHRSGPPR